MSVEAKLYFQHRYSSLQCHMILRNHSDLIIKDVLSVWKTVVLLNIFVEMVLSWIEISIEFDLFGIEMSLLSLLINLIVE